MQIMSDHRSIVLTTPSHMPRVTASTDVDLILGDPVELGRAARARGRNAQPGFEVRIQQTHLHLDFFGFSQAAQSMRRDASSRRKKVYPSVLKAEIRRPVAGPAHFCPRLFSFPSLSATRRDTLMHQRLTPKLIAACALLAGASASFGRKIITGAEFSSDGAAAAPAKK